MSETLYQNIWEKQQELESKIRELDNSKFKKLVSILKSQGWLSEISGGAFHSYGVEPLDSIVMWVFGDEFDGHRIEVADYRSGEPIELTPKTNLSGKKLELYAKLLSEVESALNSQL